MFSHKEIELVGQYMSDQLYETGENDKIEVPKELIQNTDTPEETLVKAVEIKNELNQLKAREGDKACCVYLLLNRTVLPEGWKLKNAAIDSIKYVGGLNEIKRRRDFSTKMTAESVEVIPIDEYRGQLTRSDSGKSNVDFVSDMDLKQT
uniref:Restriction endonuclease n=1 Tax=Rhabditophanes sp. KR3021 TaxID=114890 RepID=A0AC35TQQ6_9BILA